MNIEPFKEDDKEVLHKNACEIKLCDLISVSLIRHNCVSILLNPYLPLHDLQEILSIWALAILLGALCEGRLVDPAVHVGDFFRHGDVDAGTGFYGADKFSSFVEGVHRAGIEPCIAAAQGDYVQISFYKPCQKFMKSAQMPPALFPHLRKRGTASMRAS